MKKALVAAAALVVVAALFWWRSTPDVPRPSPVPPARDQDAGPVPDRMPRDRVNEAKPGASTPDVRPAVPPPSAPDAARREPALPRPSPDPGIEAPRAPDRSEVVEAEPPPTPIPPPAAPSPPAPSVEIERVLPPPAPPVRPPAAASDADLAAVQSVVVRYEQTYRALDASGVAAIWPSVDTRSLSRMFERIERQDLRFETCAYAVSGGRATATCAGSLTYVPKVGSTIPRTARHTWSIQLERAGPQWQIVSITAQ